MKHIFLYDNFKEKVSAYPFKDDYLEIHKIKEGPNKGKIIFNFTEDSNIAEIKKRSTALGCALILDSKYENIPEIREIKIDDKYRKIASNTVESILYNFLIDMGYEYEGKSTQYFFNMDVRRKLKLIFENKIKAVSLDAKNLGDILDKLREIRKEVFEVQREDFEKWETNRNIRKYNL